MLLIEIRSSVRDIRTNWGGITLKRDSEPIEIFALLTLIMYSYILQLRPSILCFPPTHGHTFRSIGSKDQARKQSSSTIFVS